MSVNWRRVALSDVCEVRKGTTITEKETVPGDIPVVAGGIRASYTHSAANRRAGTVTVSASGANAGFVNYWDVPIFASDCSTLEPRGDDRVVRRYLYHQMKRLEPWIQDSLRRGAAQPHVYARDLAKIEIDLPPIEEQRRIASILDAAEALRARRRQATAKLHTLTEAIFIEIFKSNGWDKWEAASIDGLAAAGNGSIRTGPFGSQLLHEEFVDDGIAVLGIDNAVQNRFAWGARRYITAEKYEELQRYTVSPGDVLVTIMGTTGRVAVVPDCIPTAINTKHLCCITVDQERVLPDWLWACLRFHPQVRHQLGSTHGAVMPGLNMSKIKQTAIPVPPLDVQNRFQRLKTETERLIESCRSSESQVDDLFTSLQQSAFRGHL